MTVVHEPVLHPVTIANMRPTQITVGMREVQRKRDDWKQRDADGEDKFLVKHMIPAVRGPNKDYYITDHHHLVLALHEEQVEKAFVTVNADLSMLDEQAFWVFLDNRGWMHPFDADGKRQGYSNIPREIGGLKDDPYRSLAGELRRRGGYAKDTAPFSEFLWADFLRRRIASIEGFDGAISKALDLAKSKEARYLPGWCGISDD
jgi:hypothetical protein